MKTYPVNLSCSHHHLMTDFDWKCSIFKMSQFKSTKNYTKLLNQLNFNFPGLPKIPRAPDAHSNRDLVDVYIAKKRLQLAHLLPSFDIDTLRMRAAHINDIFEQSGNLDRNFLSSLLASGYSGVVEELTTLAKEEESLLVNRYESSRSESFTDDKSRLLVLVQGLISCSEAERSDKLADKVRVRRALGEKMILAGDFWLARKMFAKAFSYIEFYDNDELDKMRVELWCLLSYVCIYHEESQPIGYNLPTKCLTLAQQLCRDKQWYMQKSVMTIVIPKIMNVYGLSNDWLQIKADRVNMYTVVTTLLHVLYVKKARYWQEELHCLNIQDGDPKQMEPQKEWMEENISEALTSALGYADEVRLSSAFIATTLRRGLFFEEQGDWDKAMEDFNAMHLLSLSFDDKEAVAMALNRIGHNYKVSKKTSMALEHFANEWEISCENGFEELKADALQDLGMVLLEEGHTWEADECMSHANAIFRETKKEDTPNKLDDLSWALMGVARGQHLWGRFATLIRTQQRENVNAVYDWKMSRKGFPIASMPQKWYKTQKRTELDEQYEAVMPKPRASSVRRSSLKEREATRERVQFAEVHAQDPTRRLFEFSPVEVASRPSIWFQDKGYGNVFGYINASDKPRVVPRFHDAFDVDFMDDIDMTLSEIKLKAEDDDETLYKKRRNEARRRGTSMGQSLRNSVRGRVTLTEKGMADWLKHDFRLKSWERKAKSRDRLSKMLDPALGMGERLRALLDDMDDMAKYDDDDDYGVVKIFDGETKIEADDESDDSELFKAGLKKSRMDSAMMEEFQKFDEKQLGF